MKERKEKKKKRKPILISIFSTLHLFPFQLILFGHQLQPVTKFWHVSIWSPVATGYQILARINLVTSCNQLPNFGTYQFGHWLQPVTIILQKIYKKLNPKNISGCCYCSIFSLRTKWQQPGIKIQRHYLVSFCRQQLIITMADVAGRSF